MNVPVYFDPKVIDAGPVPVRTQGETPAHYQERYVDWQTKMGMVDWDSLIVNGMIAKDPSLASQRDYLSSLYASSEAYRLRDMVFADPSLIGKKENLTFLGDANVDVWLKGNIDRSLPDDQQQLDPEIRKLADDLKAKVYLKIPLIPLYLRILTLVVHQQLVVLQAHSWVHYS